MVRHCSAILLWNDTSRLSIGFLWCVHPPPPGPSHLIVRPRPFSNSAKCVHGTERHVFWLRTYVANVGNVKVYPTIRASRNISTCDLFVWKSCFRRRECALTFLVVLNNSSCRVEYLKPSLDIPTLKFCTGPNWKDFLYKQSPNNKIHVLRTH